MKSKKSFPPPKNARELALYVLMDVEEKKAYSNLQLKHALAGKEWDSREVNLTTELVYGTLSRLNTLDWMISHYLSKPISKLENWVKWLLRISFYQLTYLDRIPSRAVVHEGVEIAKRWGHKGISGMVNGVLRNRLRNPEKAEIPADLPPVQRISLTYSHPEWLVKKWIEQFGVEETEQMCEENNFPPEINLRANALKGTREELMETIKNQLPKAYVQPSKVVPMGVVLSESGNIGQLPAYREGLCTVQDESSMLVGEALAPLPGMKVLDVCAAPGGKSTHIAEKMNNQGKVLSMDIHPHKLKLIEENGQRLGISIIETRAGDAREVDRILNGETFDRILVDAPCTGLGVIRRKPDIRWAKTEKDEEIHRIQYAILCSAASLLKPEGKLVYSTCTVQREENQDVIQRFLQEHPDWELDSTLAKDLPVLIGEKYATLKDGYVQILPHHFHSDGFFIARLKRKSGTRD